MIWICSTRLSIRNTSLPLQLAAPHPRQWKCHHSTLPQPREPLRILFCGSDHFSSASLRALHKLQIEQPDIVSSIDVVHRPAKPTGRGLKKLRQVPVQEEAQELGLRRHELDTFKDWQLIDGINLIVAVSFGLFIPKNIIDASRFGGINVHPSLLPDLQGSSPIHHTLLLRRPHTGVTVQTLDPYAFDRGTRLLQTPAIPISPWPETLSNDKEPGNEQVNISSTAFPDGLTRELASVAASSLLQTIHERRYEEPQKDRGWAPAEPSTRAPKITKADAEIKWKDWTSDETLLRNRVLGDLWTTQILANKKRLILRKILPVPAVFRETISRNAPRGWFPHDSPLHFPVGFCCPLPDVRPPWLILGTIDGKGIAVQEWTIEGEPKNTFRQPTPDFWPLFHQIIGPDPAAQDRALETCPTFARDLADAREAIAHTQTPSSSMSASASASAKAPLSPTRKTPHALSPLTTPHQQRPFSTSPCPLRIQPHSQKLPKPLSLFP